MCYDLLFSFSFYFCFTCTFLYLFYPCLIPVSTAPCFLHVLLIYFIQGCAPHTIIMFNHDDSILFPDSFRLTLIYKYSRDSSLYSNLLLRIYSSILSTLKPCQLVNNCTKAQIVNSIVDCRSQYNFLKS